MLLEYAWLTAQPEFGSSDNVLSLWTADRWASEAVSPVDSVASSERYTMNRAKRTLRTVAALRIAEAG